MLGRLTHLRLTLNQTDTRPVPLPVLMGILQSPLFAQTFR